MDDRYCLDALEEDRVVVRPVTFSVQTGFPSSDPVAIWLIRLGLVYNDLQRDRKVLRLGHDCNELELVLYAFRQALLHSHQVMELLREGDPTKKVHEFFDGCEEHVRECFQKLKRVRKAGFLDRVITPLRLRQAHLVPSDAVCDFLEDFDKSTSVSLKVENGRVVFDLPLLTDAELAIRLHPLPPKIDSEEFKSVISDIAKFHGLVSTTFQQGVLAYLKSRGII